MGNQASMNLFFRCILGVLCFAAVSQTSAFAGSYSDSAHGNDSSYGVLRTSMPSNYVRGNCGHCHEQHASIDGDEPSPDNDSQSAYLLLSGGFSGTASNTYQQSDSACFQCHVELSSKQSGSITNQNYAATFGGESPATASDIMAAFNLSSYHNLDDIQDYLGTAGFTGLSSDNNPCSGCHNVHIAKANWRDTDNPEQAAISRPTDHESLWGPEDGDGATYETMKEYAEAGGATYRAPFYVGASSGTTSTEHEPDGVSRTISSTQVQGSTTPNYNAFCLDCHQSSINGRRAIDFSSTGDKHGFKAAGTAGNQGNRIAPYTTDGTSSSSYDSSTNFVLSCLDCHEPHGSSNFDLLRSTINGVSDISAGSTGAEVCYGCHSAAGHQSGGTCINCHYHNNPFGRF